MSQQDDQMVDRRALKRKLRLWRSFAIIAGMFALGLVLIGGNGPGSGLIKSAQIARVTIQGVITDDLKQQRLLAQISKAKYVKAVILRINSPGGTTTGSEALFASIRNVAKRKPVVAVLGTVAASGGYIAAIASDHIVARGNTITGSIGVIFQWAQVANLLEKIGVGVETVKSGPLKGQPSPFTKTNPDARKAMEAMVADSFEWFVGLVANRRPIKLEQARILADGRVYTGRSAVKNKLIDQIGGEATAVKWLTEKRQISKGLKIVDWQASTSSRLGLPSGAGAVLLWLFGSNIITDNIALAGKALNVERLSLDGLVSVWQPER